MSENRVSVRRQELERLEVEFKSDPSKKINQEMLDGCWKGVGKVSKRGLFNKSLMEVNSGRIKIFRLDSKKPIDCKFKIQRVQNDLLRLKLASWSFLLSFKSGGIVLEDENHLSWTQEYQLVSEDDFTKAVESLIHLNTVRDKQIKAHDKLVSSKEMIAKKEAFDRELRESSSKAFRRKMRKMTDDEYESLYKDLNLKYFGHESFNFSFPHDLKY